MIPKANIIQWQEYAPWIDEIQIEQDLILSRILVDIFSDNFLAAAVAFRGGTALHKLYINPAGRYSEDIDLVQINPGPIGDIVNAIRSKLDNWLGFPTHKRKQDRFILNYKFNAEAMPSIETKIKIEINTREHVCFHEFQFTEFSVNNSWYSKKANITIFSIEELLSTKIRALYQRKKGRDLFDLHLALDTINNIDHKKILQCFHQYQHYNNQKITRAQFEKNLAEKLFDTAFLNDINPLLPTNRSLNYNVKLAAHKVHEAFIQPLPGEPWKGGFSI